MMRRKMDYQNLYADRLGGTMFGKNTEIFKFEKIKRAKRAAMQENPELELIDLGIGESDDCADELIQNEMDHQIRRWENRGYADNGILEFQQAAAAFMQDYFGVSGLNPEKEILHVMGSKSALSMLPSAFINPGDVTLMTVPGYPILGTKTQWLGGEVYPLPLRPQNQFLPDLQAIPDQILQRAKLIYVNYPNNPTGAIATKEFFEELITFAKKHQMIVIQDAAYSELTFSKERRLSFLSLPGAKEVGVEIHSMSKAYNMTGWRLGYVAGNENVIKALATVKDQTDSGTFRAIQMASVLALQHPELIQNNINKYVRRHRALVDALQSAGFEVTMPEATFYLYAKAPKGTVDGVHFHDAGECCDYLIKKAHISAVPWSDAGEYIRFSVTFVADGLEEEQRVMQELKRRLSLQSFVY